MKPLVDYCKHTLVAMTLGGVGCVVQAASIAAYESQPKYKNPTPALTQELNVLDLCGSVSSTLPRDNTLLNTHNSALPPRPTDRAVAEIGKLPGDARILLTVSRVGAPADGVSVLKVGIELLDSANNPYTADTDVLLETQRGRLQPDAMQTAVGSTRLQIKGGKACVNLIAPHEPGESRLVASSGPIVAEGTLQFTPDLRPMIAVGVIDAQFSMKQLKKGALVEPSQDDGFEETVKEFGNASGRAALFLKGKIKGDTLLTLAYDSDKPARDGLFRDINPNQFYPVYGDASIKGFDAQSAKRLYIRLDQDRAFALYGDIQTAEPSSHWQAQGLALGQYQRTLTGAKGHAESQNGHSVNVFLANETIRQVVEEIRGKGISGPYSVSNPNGVANSEVVQILTRDRNQPAVILSTVNLTRFVDYDFEPFSGRILFKSPVPGVDENLNPVSIRIAYEVDGGGPSYWVGGVNGHYQLSKNIAIGGSAVHNGDSDPGTGGTAATLQDLRSLNTVIRIGNRQFIVGEVAQSQQFSGASGYAGRLEYRFDGLKVDSRVAYTTAGENFYNPSAPITAGRSEFTAKMTYRLRNGASIVTDAVSSEDRATASKQNAAAVSLLLKLSERLNLDVGVRWSQDSSSGTQLVSASPTYSSFWGYGLGSTANTGTQQEQSSLDSVTSTGVESLAVRGRLTGKLGDNANLYGEAEVDTSDSTRKMLALGGDYRVAEKTRLYGRHELTNSLAVQSVASLASGRSSVLGMSTDYMNDGQVFSEYRLRDSASGRENYAASGVRNLWDIGHGLRMSTSAEYLTVTGTNAGHATALGLGLDSMASPTTKMAGRIEFRTDPSVNYWLNTLALDHKLNLDWTLFGRNYTAFGDDRTGVGNSLQWRTVLGTAWRETDKNRWNALAKYEFKRTLEPTTPTDSNAHIIAMNVNWQPTLKLTLSGQFGTKWLDEVLDGVNSASVATLVGGRAMYDIVPKWDVGALANVLFSSPGKARQYNLGLETGYRFYENFWVSLGYNFLGFDDGDLSGTDYTNKGVFVRLRFKFNEDLFKFDDPKVNRSLPQAASSVTVSTP